MFIYLQFYLRMSEIQTTHRRVIMIHCDRITTKRIFDIGRRLDLLSGDKIWIIIDGIIGDDITSPSLWRDLNLPTGVIALRQRAQQIDNVNTLNSIIKLIGQAALRTYRNYKYWITNEQGSSTKISSFRNGTMPEVSCWHNITITRKKYNQVVYR